MDQKICSQYGVYRNKKHDGAGIVSEKWKKVVYNYYFGEFCQMDRLIVLKSSGTKILRFKIHIHHDVKKCISYKLHDRKG
jgi:DNA integrity scanning protein DisA with diadenylate cyclase activity